MRLMGLDISSSTGIAVADYNQSNKLLELLFSDYLDAKKETPLSLHKNERGQYAPVYHPEDFWEFTNEYIDYLLEHYINKYNPDTLVIEQTNKGRDRWRQKMLEFLHYELYTRVRNTVKVRYIDTSEWRNLLEIKLTKEQKRNNRRLKKDNVRGGKINPKKLAIQFVQDNYGLKFLVKQNDEAEAICLINAFVQKTFGVPNEIRCSSRFTPDKK